MENNYLLFEAGVVEFRKHENIAAIINQSTTEDYLLLPDFRSLWMILKGASLWR